MIMDYSKITGLGMENEPTKPSELSDPVDPSLSFTTYERDGMEYPFFDVLRYLDTAGERTASAMFSGGQLPPMRQATYELHGRLLEEHLCSLLAPHHVTVRRERLLRFVFESSFPMYVRLWPDREPVLTQRFWANGNWVHDSIGISFDYDPFLSPGIKSAVDCPVDPSLPESASGIETKEKVPDA